MAFQSLQFIVFFIIFFWTYWLLCKNKTAQNIYLLVASYGFYAFFDWRCLILLLITSISIYFTGLYFKKKGANKVVCASAIVLNLSILGFFKYYNFFLSSLTDIIGGGYTPLNIILPVGISFYTFSAVSYIVDTYKGDVNPTEDIIACLLYTSFFPAILSGPIHKASQQLPQYLHKREFDYDLIVAGFMNFVWGCFMKLCVADRIGMYVDAVYGNLMQHSGNTLFITSILYTIQIYADFSGYSLMAIGCGKMLGIRLQTNFIRPYFSRTITEFWSKWHMSLTGWFKSYVYIPLGGNRVGKIKWICNIMIVFLLSGLWHGAAYTFIIWGLIHGLAQVIEKLLLGKNSRNHIISENRIIQNSYCLLSMLVTFSIVSFAWIFFRLPSLDEATFVISKIFTDRGSFFMDPTLLLALFSLILLLFKDIIDEYMVSVKQKLYNVKVFRYIVTVFLICYILLFGVLESGQFIYFQF